MNSALHANKDATVKNPDVTITLICDEFNMIIMKKFGLEGGIKSGNIKIDGNKRESV